ncbi:MAG: LysM peptidoglycan-binding domain-containing protein [Treponema sp.]|jgi:membrane-bound lytic murein transglycosylase D|nr:LysM peptidoglycan-binding domain-containing protein [Treponema sp.]
MAKNSSGLFAGTLPLKILLGAAVFAAAGSPASAEIPAGREIPAAAPAGVEIPAWHQEIFPSPVEALPPREGEAGRPLRRLVFPKPERFTDTRALSREETEGRSLSIPGLENALTRHYIEQYTSPGGIAWLNAVMRRGAPYLGFIRREIEERNLPGELLYLPVIESGYLATALSRSGAAGLWQFMRNSMGPFDMKVDDWVDERMDFWKSTQGALRKLEENYRRFEDWPLALAAYNTGLGGINRVVKDTGIEDYWVLSERKALKTETIHYVPKLLAVAWIMSRPRRFGLESWQKDIEWTRIPAAGRTVDLSLLAAESGIDPALLRAGNRELIYQVTPPDKAHQIKVPLAYLPLVTEILERKGPELIKNYFHTVRYGDTLWALALHYGVTVELIENANPGIRSEYLRIGSRLRIPALKEAGPYPGTTAASGAADFSGNHLVKKGETLWAISLIYEVDPEILAQANGMELNDTLREGRNLKVPIK